MCANKAKNIHEEKIKEYQKPQFWGKTKDHNFQRGGNRAPKIGGGGERLSGPLASSSARNL